MRQNKELINKLKQQLRESSFKGDQLKKLIDSMQKQMEEKEAQLQALREELDKKDIHIAELDETVANLTDNVNQLTEETTQRAQVISNQDKDLHTAWFVFGYQSVSRSPLLLETLVVCQKFGMRHTHFPTRRNTILRGLSEWQNHSTFASIFLPLVKLK